MPFLTDFSYNIMGMLSTPIEITTLCMSSCLTCSSCLKKTCLYKILFLTTIETIETTFVTMYLFQCEACCLCCLYCRFNHLSCHANIVQRVKTCYKIKINSRESKSCFYGFLQHQSHPRPPSKSPKCPHRATFTV